MNLVVHLLVDSLYQTLHCLYFLYTDVYYEMYICTPHTTSSGYISLLDSSLFASYIEMTYVTCVTLYGFCIIHHNSIISITRTVLLFPFPQNFVKELQIVQKYDLCLSVS